MKGWDEMSESSIQLLKPKYVPLVRFFSLNNVLISLATFYFVVMSLLIYCGIALNKNWILVLLISIVIALIVLLFLVWLDKKNFEVSSYKIFNDRVEFEEGFINHKYIAIKFEDIKEVHLSQNFFQRMVNIGTIKFITAANNTGRNTGVAFTDIENSNYVYAKVKELLNK